MSGKDYLHPNRGPTNFNHLTDSITPKVVGYSKPTSSPTTISPSYSSNTGIPSSGKVIRLEAGETIESYKAKQQMNNQGYAGTPLYSLGSGGNTYGGIQAGVRVGSTENRGSSDYQSYGGYTSPTTFSGGGSGEIQKVLNDLTEVRGKKNNLENELSRIKSDLDVERKKYSNVQEQLERQKNENMKLKNELNRVAVTSGGIYNQGTGQLTTHNEYVLSKKNEELTAEVRALKDDKEKLSIINHDLKRYVPEYKGEDPDDPDLDGSFLDLKHKNVIETMDITNKQIRKKNKILLEENEMLKTQLRVICSADSQIQDQYMSSEIGKLQGKLKEMKNKICEQDILLNAFQTEEKYGNTGGKKKGEGFIFDDGLKDEHNRLKRELQGALKRIKELESGEHAITKRNSEGYKSLMGRINDLESENDKLLARIKDHNRQDKPDIGKDDTEKDVEIYRLRRENEQLRQELVDKAEVIKKMQGLKGGDNTEAMQNLMKANERLMAQMLKYQENLNQSQTNMSNYGKNHTNMGDSKKPMIKSEFVDPYKGDKDLSYLDY
jgi:hypothetical protein